MRYYIEEDKSTTPSTLVKVPICGSYINYNTAPIGSIQQYSGTVLPSGWLYCNGSAYNRTFFPFLFKVIGTTYGTGDGSTTFNVPNIPDLATGIKYIIKAYSTADAKTLGIDLPDSPTGGGGHWAHEYEQWTTYLNGLTPGSTFVAPKTGSLYVHPTAPPAGAAPEAVYRSYIAPIENGVTLPSIIWVSQSLTQSGSMITNVSSGILKKGHTYKIDTSNPNGFCYAATFLEYVEDEADPDPAGDTYSTIETKVGTWIDGKPIYRKVITGTVTTYVDSGTRRTFAISDDISFIDRLIDMRGNYTINNGTSTIASSVNGIWLGSDMKPSAGVRYGIYSSGAGKNIWIYTVQTITSASYELILEYTKQ